MLVISWLLLLVRLLMDIVSNIWVIRRNNCGILAFLPWILLMWGYFWVSTCHQPLMIKHRVIVAATNALSQQSCCNRDICLFLAQVYAFTLLLHSLFVLCVSIKYYIRINALIRPRHPHLSKLLRIVDTICLSKKAFFWGFVLSGPRWMLFCWIKTVATTLVDGEVCRQSLL